MKLTIYKNPDNTEDYIWVIDIKERYADIWYNEMTNRLIKAEWERFDIDESYETGCISLWHLEEMIKFLNNK